MKLYPYQEIACRQLVQALTTHQSALDASDTGVGKTYTALGVARALEATPLVLCPKSVITPWKRVASEMGVTPVDVLNIEKLKAGNTKYLKKVGKNKWVWNLPRGSLLIYDEVQTASGHKSQNGKILGLCKAYGIKALMLSATVAESPLKLKAIGYMLGLHKYVDHFSWCLKYGCWQNSWGGLEFIKGKQRLGYLRRIHEQIFPDKGCRVKIQDLDVFPENTVYADAFDLDERSTEEIRRVYEEMDEELAKPDAGASELTAQLRARQRTELLKVPLLIELIDGVLEEERSAVVFVNFTETLEKLQENFKDASSVFGGQKQVDRDSEIERFQADITRVCLVMIQAGGVGLSLHDLHGDYPRTSIISPPFNAVQVKQALGRIHRAGAKTKCVQRIIFAANTVEEDACKAVRRKLDNMSMLNDGDLSMSIFETKGDRDGEEE